MVDFEDGGVVVDWYAVGAGLEECFAGGVAEAEAEDGHAEMAPREAVGGAEGYELGGFLAQVLGHGLDGEVVFELEGVGEAAFAEVGEAAVALAGEGEDEVVGVGVEVVGAEAVEVVAVLEAQGVDGELA